MWGPKFAMVEGIESDRIVKFIGLFVQILAALKAVQSIVSVWKRACTKPLRQQKLIRILLPMSVTITGNSKLRSLSYDTTDTIIQMLQHQVGGYTFWQGLPKYGVHNKKSLRKKIADTLLSSFFSTPFLEILLKTAFTKEGKPVQPLYNWLVETVYGNNVQRLYADWLNLSKE